MSVTYKYNIQIQYIQIYIYKQRTSKFKGQEENANVFMTTLLPIVCYTTAFKYDGLNAQFDNTSHDINSLLICERH